MCGGGKKQETAPVVPTPPTPQIVQDMLRANDLGPTGYTDAMRANLGLDTQWGGVQPTSGMVNSVPAFTGYKPVRPPADPLVEILKRAPKPSGRPVVVVKPVTPTDPRKPTTPTTPTTRYFGGRNSR